MGMLAIALLLQAAGQVFNQQTGGDGLVVMEAESAGGSVTVGGDTWTLVNAGTTPAAPTTPTSFQGTGAMVCLPNNGSGNTNAATFVNGARLDFRVLFRSTGTHYVWVRGRAYDDTAATPSQPPGNNDSCHVSIDGTAAAGAFQMQGFNATDWTWRRTTAAGTATIDVPAIGVHTVSLYMREDGFMADRILLTTNSGYSGVTNGGTQNGPAQSGQIADLTPGPAAPPTLIPGSFQIRVDWTAVTNAQTYRLERSDGGGDWQVVFSGNALTYTDVDLFDHSVQRCYRVAGVHGVFGPGPVSDPSCTFSQLPPPRTKDHDEGALGENCACGSRIPGSAGTALAGLASVLLLLAFRRR